MEWFLAFTTRPLGRRDSTHRPGPSARQRARPAKLSERQFGLWRHFGCARALAFQEQPSLPSNLHSHGSSPCGFPQPQHWCCSHGVEHPPEKWEPPQVTHWCAYPQLRCVWPERWQRLHCSRPFGTTHASTDSLKPQISVSDCTFNTSGTRASDTMM